MLRTGRSSEAAHTRWHKWLKGTEQGQAALAKSRAAKESLAKKRSQAVNGRAKAVYQREASGEIVRVEPSQKAGDVAVAEGRAVPAPPPPYLEGSDGGGDGGGNDSSDGGGNDGSDGGGNDRSDDGGGDGGDVDGGNGVDGLRTLTAEEREELTQTPTWLSAEEAVCQAAKDGLTLELSANSAGYKGVTVLERIGQFGAQAGRQFGRSYLGTYETKEAAALAIARYNRARGVEPGPEKEEEEEEEETPAVDFNATDRLDLRARRAFINEEEDAAHHCRVNGHKRQRDM